MSPRTDGFTKFEKEIYTAALTKRLPNMPLCDKPEDKPPNAINSPEFARQWKAKDDEMFDD